MSFRKYCNAANANAEEHQAHAIQQFCKEQLRSRFVGMAEELFMYNEQVYQSEQEIDTRHDPEHQEQVIAYKGGTESNTGRNNRRKAAVYGAAGLPVRQSCLQIAV